MGSSSSKTSKNTLLADIDKITIVDIISKETFQSSYLWSEPGKCVIIYVIRRAGCPLCREQAELLADLVEYQLTGVSLVKIIFELQSFLH